MKYKIIFSTVFENAKILDHDEISFCLLFSSHYFLLNCIGSKAREEELNEDILY